MILFLAVLYRTRVVACMLSI